MAKINYCIDRKKSLLKGRKGNLRKSKISRQDNKINFALDNNQDNKFDCFCKRKENTFLYNDVFFLN